nr:hypothetical protein [Tanacetum cinerariifolium]
REAGRRPRGAVHAVLAGHEQADSDRALVRRAAGAADAGGHFREHRPHRHHGGLHREHREGGPPDGRRNRPH